MGTYINCYSLLEDVRESLNEFSPAYVQGSDTSGTYRNRYLIRKINEAHRKIYNILMAREDISEEFVTEASLVGVNSVYTLPADYGKMIEFRDADGVQIHSIGQTDRHLTSAVGSAQHYYRKGNTLIIDKGGLTATCTLIYYRKARYITTGAATAGGALSITLAANASALADYYNDMDIENVTSSWVDTISDYSTGRVATIGAQTAVVGDFYGIVPDTPEMFHEFIAPIATYLVKLDHPASQEKPHNSEMIAIRDNITDALIAYTGHGDIAAEEFFMDEDFGSTAGGIV